MADVLRATSRHRSASRFRPGPRARLVLGRAAPWLSLAVPLALVVLVQGLSPAAQHLPTGAGRYDLAAAWLSARPGALAGTGLSTGSPVLGRAQLGLLLELLRGGDVQSVLAAAHGAMLLLAAAQTGLAWWLLRRAGSGRVSAGLAAAVLGVAPAAVLAHSAISATAIGVCWALLAGALVVGPGGVIRAAAGGAAAVVAATSAPSLLPVLLVAAVLLLVARLREHAPEARRALVAAAAGAAGAAVVLGAIGAVLGALPRTSDGRSLAAVETAQGGAPALGGAGLATWWAADPLLVVLAVVGVAVVARRRPILVVPFLAAVAAAVWPGGADAVTPLLVLLPALAVVLAAAADTGVAALADPRFVRSVAGSGWLTGMAALVVVGLIVWGTGLGDLVRGGDQPVSRVERWLSTGVPAGQTVLVGLGAWPDLSRATRARVGWYAGGAAAVPSSMPWRSADYVVTDASLPARRAGAAARALDRSLEVARYGSGSAAMEVRAVRVAAAPTPTPTATPPSTAAERAALETRKQAGEQLARNPRLVVDGDQRAELAAGAVDMRVAVVLAQFMTDHTVTIAGFGDEDSAGVLHGVTVSRVDGKRVPTDAAATGALLRFLSELGGDVAATSIDAGTRGVTATFG